jgi:hypothetical protein
LLGEEIGRPESPGVDVRLAQKQIQVDPGLRDSGRSRSASRIEVLQLDHSAHHRSISAARPSRVRTLSTK